MLGLAAPAARQRADLGQPQVQVVFLGVADRPVHLWLTKVRALAGAWGRQAEHRARVMAAIADGSLAWN